MTTPCEAPTTIRQMKAGWWAPVAFVGGSLTVGTGSSDTSSHSWRRRFARYLHDRYERLWHCRIGEVMLGIGAMPSYGMSFLFGRYIEQKKPTLVFLEHCVNDSGCANPTLVKKGIEGLIRQARSLDCDPDIVLLCAATRPGSDAAAKTRAAFSLHQEVARHYGIPCIDVGEYLLRTLEQRGQGWEAVGVDDFHLNDYGNGLWFDCLREWFDKQVLRFDLEPLAQRLRGLCQPYCSDECASTKLIDLSKKSRRLTLEGDWHVGAELSCPWWIGTLLVGRPGAKLALKVTGTAIGLVSMMQPNGLKVEAVLDGEEVPGPYTNWVADFGNFLMLGHGMEQGEHLLELTVQPPLRGKNLDNPTAWLAYACVAGSG